MREASSDPRGHQADAPSKMPGRAWKDIAARTYKRTWDDNVALVSAGVAFYGFFALLSLIGLIVIAYGFFAEPATAIGHMSALTSVLPTQIAVLIGDQLLRAIDASQKAKGLALLIAVAVAFYGGTNGASAVITALNIAYEEKEKRGLVRFYLLALGMTASALVVAGGARGDGCPGVPATAAAAGQRGCGHCRQGRRLSAAGADRGRHRRHALPLRTVTRGGEVALDHARIHVRGRGLDDPDGRIRLLRHALHQLPGKLRLAWCRRGAADVDVSVGLCVRVRSGAQQ
jgi:hypothetical protein